MNAETGLAPDAAVALGIASTAMPFARSRDAEAERWLRILRMHGESGLALTALGVSEARLGNLPARETRELPAVGDSPRDTVSLVTEQAIEFAARSRREVVNTRDVLLAVMRVYGAGFDRVLEAHGTDRAEVLKRLGVVPPR